MSDTTPITASVTNISRPLTKSKAMLAPSPEGVIDAKLSWLFGPSYRTRIPGLVAMGLGSVLALGQLAPGLVPPQVLMLATLALPIVSGAGITVAKESRVSGVKR